MPLQGIEVNLLAPVSTETGHHSVELQQAEHQAIEALQEGLPLLQEERPQLLEVQLAEGLAVAAALRQWQEIEAEVGRGEDSETEAERGHFHSMKVLLAHSFDLISTCKNIE